MSRRKPRGPGRPTLLSPEVHKSLIESTESGAPMTAAAVYAGVSLRVFERWMQRGYLEDLRVTEADDVIPDDDEQPYRDLYQEVQVARAKATVRNAGLIQRSAIGGIVTEKTIRRYRDENGQMVEEETVKRTPPDWKAAAWWLERRDGQNFGKTSDLNLEISGPGGAPIEIAGKDAEALGEKVRDHIALLSAAAATAAEAAGDDVVDADVVED